MINTWWLDTLLPKTWLLWHWNLHNGSFVIFLLHKPNVFHIHSGRLVWYYVLSTIDTPPGVLGFFKNLEHITNNLIDRSTDIQSKLNCRQKKPFKIEQNSQKCMFSESALQLIQFYLNIRAPTHQINVCRCLPDF